MIWINVGNQKSYGYSCEARAATRSCCRSACARHTSPPAPPASSPRWSSGLDRCTLWSRPTPASCTARRSPYPCKVSGWSTHSFGLNSKSDVRSLIGILTDTLGQCFGSPLLVEAFHFQIRPSPTLPHVAVFAPVLCHLHPVNSFRAFALRSWRWLDGTGQLWAKA